MEVNIAKGYFWTIKGLKGRQGIETLQQALSAQANCGPCGCDNCLGYWTNIDVTTGKLSVMYIDDGDLIIQEYDAGITELKARKETRDAS